MTSITVDGFDLTSDMREPSNDGNDYQFGMDFTLKNTKNLNDQRYALCQLIFPMSPVGNNIEHQWNIDNHSTGNQIIDLAYKGSTGGTIKDTPTEICGIKKIELFEEEYIEEYKEKYDKDPEEIIFIDETQFCIFILDLVKGTVSKNGVTLGYSFRTIMKDNIRKGEIIEHKIKKCTLTPVQFDLLQQRFLDLTQV
jgi:hypothetical protein